MTISTRLIGLIMTMAMLTGSVAAQELPLPGFGESADPLDLTLPSDNALGPSTSNEGSEDSLLSGSIPMSVEAIDGVESPTGCDAYTTGPHDLWDDYSAPIESTGTWLRRGFWYAEAEAVVWNRFWNRDSKFFAAQDVNVTNPQFFPRPPTANASPIFSTNRLLMVDGSQPGEDASVRFKLGHFLFRDSRNRDHTAELTVMGGGDWHQHRVLASEQNFGLFVPFYISGNNRTFNQSTAQQVDYSSHYTDFEANYRVKSRMRRDRLVMDPNGHWHRAANPGITRDYLIGLRYMDLRDILDWRAEDIAVLGDDGTYFIRTDNNLFGMQMGAGAAYETARWSLGANSKMGFYVNDATGRTTLNFTADDDDDADLRMVNDAMSWIAEVQVTGRWHLSPNYSLRASYELMYLTSLALAPYQATFITDLSYLNTSGDTLYHGMSFGFEGYW